MVAPFYLCVVCGLCVMCVVFVLDKFVLNKMLTLVWQKLNQNATQRACVFHRHFHISTAFTHPTIHKPMDKTMENLWRTFFLFREVATKNLTQSATRGLERCVARRVVAPNQAALLLPPTAATRAFDFSLTTWRKDVTLHRRCKR